LRAWLRNWCKTMIVLLSYGKLDEYGCKMFADAGTMMFNA